ncbi:MAG: lipopolysaccharide transport system permease protein [Pseudohongiellaceae bacterium]|jgi:lipopolysaccharide transport system permease protein
MYQYISFKVRATLKAQARNNYLGYLWWGLEPLLLMSVFYFVFGVLFQRGGEGFEKQLLIGVSVWLWFASSVNMTSSSLMQAKALMHRVYIPKIVVILISYGVSCAKQFFVFSILIAFLLFFSEVKVTWLYFPILVFIQCVFNASIGIFAAAIVPYVPDLRFIIPPVLQLLMFCSGVFYTVSSLPLAIQPYLLMNPISNLIDQYRSVLVLGDAPNFVHLLIIFGCSVVFIFVSIMLLIRSDRYYPRLIY